MGAAQNCQEPSAPSFPQPVYDNTITAVKSAFGDMIGYSISKFGSMRTVGKIILYIFVSIWLILFIFIVVGLFSSIIPEKKKIAAIPRRIAAAFGRQIKAIRKM